MKPKQVLALILVIGIMLMTCSCQHVEKEEGQDGAPSMFVEVETTSLWRVVYHRVTKVMYATSLGTYNSGSFTLLVNPDGTPMLWES